MSLPSQITRKRHPSIFLKYLKCPLPSLRVSVGLSSLLTQPLQVITFWSVLYKPAVVVQNIHLAARFWGDQAVIPTWTGTFGIQG